MSTETSVKSVSREAPSIYAIQQGSAYLKVGDVGDSVLTCRGLLNQKGYSCNLTSETYDSVLKSVVAKFQKDFGLTYENVQLKVIKLGLNTCVVTDFEAVSQYLTLDVVAE